MADQVVKFAPDEKITCWACGGAVIFKNYYTTWECRACDVSGAKVDLLTPPYLGNSWKFTGYDSTMHTEPYIDHAVEHVPCPA